MHLTTIHNPVESHLQLSVLLDAIILLSDVGVEARTHNLGRTLMDPRVVPVRRSASMADSEKVWLEELLKRW
jgi:hypothetical protein